MEDPQTIGMHSNERQPQVAPVTSNGPQNTGTSDALPSLTPQSQTTTGNGLATESTLAQQDSRGTTSRSSAPNGTVNIEMHTSAGLKEEKQKKQTFMDKLPSWLSSSLKDKRKWKTFVRVMVAFITTMVLMVVNKTLEVQGQAAFFGTIVCVMLPPIMPSTVFLFAVATLVVGMCVGWAWGCAAMAASLRARSVTLLASQYTRAESQLVSGVNPDSQFQVFIFHGEFLDPASTVVFGIFFFIGTYAMGSVRAKAPKLTLFAIFGTIVMDVMCSYGPLFPSAQYTLATTFLIPTGFYVAIALASIFLVFPQTLNHAVTSGLIDAVLRPTNNLIELQGRALHTEPSDYEAWSAVNAETSRLRKAFAQGLAAVLGQAGLLEAEVSRGRLGAGDLKALIEKIKVLSGRAVGMGSFQHLVEQQHKANLTADRHTANPTDTPSGKDDPHFNPRVQHIVRSMKEEEERNGHALDSLLPILEQTSSQLRSTCYDALADGIEWLDWVNSHRWRRAAKAYPKDCNAESGLAQRQRKIAELKAALGNFLENEHQKLLAPFRNLFDPSTGELLSGKDDEGVISARNGMSTRSLFLCFVFSTNLVSYATALISLLETLADVEQRNPVNRFQLPTALGNLFKVAASPSARLNPLEMGDDEAELDDREEVTTASSSSSTIVNNTTEDQEKPSKKHRKHREYPRDPDADSPRNGLQRFSRRIRTFWGWQTSPQGLFALKYSLVSIALWIPAICPSSAYFIYVNRGLWALIMAQTGLGVYAGEQIGAFVLRMSGTLFGLVLGMACWYCGAGIGPGNPYGVVAATSAFMAPFFFLRFVAPPHIMPFFLMTGVTIVFVVGYSWIDTHIVQLANQGTGYTLAWRRALLVIIGFTAAFLISIFPFRVQSAKKSLRLGIAKSLDLVSTLFASEVEGIIDEAQMPDEEYDPNERTSVYRTKILALVTRLQAIEPLLGQASIEPGMKGPWPKGKYATLLQLEYELLGALSLLSNAWSRMRPSWDRLLAERAHFFDPIFIADTMSMFALLVNCLRHGQPLPPLVPLQERLANLRLRTLREKRQVQNDEYVRSQTIVPMTWESIQSEQLAIFATATIALSSIINTTDRITDVVRSLVGERDFEALERKHRNLAQGELERDLGRSVQV